MRRWWREVLWSVGTAAGAAAVSYALMPLVVVVAVFGIVIAHEAGHFLAALGAGAKPSLPRFVPFGFAVVGITKVAGLVAPWGRAIGLAGPVAGVFVALGVLSAGLALEISVLVALGAGAVIVEAVGAGIGDRRRSVRG